MTEQLELGFNTRKDSGMNLLFSYSVIEDNSAIALGYKFLGAGRDIGGYETHVFQIESLEQANAKSTN